MADFRAMTEMPMPVIDRKISHVGVSGLRKLDSKRLREFDENILVIQDHNTPLAVLLSYEQYLIIQDQLATVMQTLEVLSDSEEVQALLAGINEAKEGKFRSIQEIRRDLKDRGK